MTTNGHEWTRINPGKQRPPVLLAFACAAWLGIRLFYNGLRQLVPDEAYYWVWSRHLAGGYLDHPPMVAWMIRAATTAFGINEFGVRAPAALCTLAMILIAIGLTRTLCPDRRAAWWTAAILLLCPMTAVMGTIMAPDTPACLFAIAALAAAVAACRNHPAWWIAFGLSTGLAVISKYTAVLGGLAVALALLSTPAGRRQFLRPWPWLAILVALAVFSPVVIWNHHHDWASFRFQWHHGAGADPSSPAVNLLSYLAGQAGIYTPVLFVIGIIALLWRWRTIAALDTAQRIILFAATLPLLFFALFSLRHRPEPNWPVAAYLPLTIILANWLADGWRPARVQWMHLGIIVATVMTVFSQTPEILAAVPVRWVAGIPSRWDDLFGWRDMGRALDDRANSDGVVYCTSYENAAEAMFYMKDHPQTWTLNTDRPTEFDFLPNRPDPASLPKVVYVTRASAAAPAPPQLRRFGKVAAQSWHTTALGRVVRRRWIIVAER